MQNVDNIHYKLLFLKATLSSALTFSNSMLRAKTLIEAYLSILPS